MKIYNLKPLVQVNDEVLPGKHIHTNTPFTSGIYLHMPSTRGNCPYIFTSKPRVWGNIHICTPRVRDYIGQYSPELGIYVFLTTLLEFFFLFFLAFFSFLYFLFLFFFFIYFCFCFLFFLFFFFASINIIATFLQTTAPPIVSES